MDQRPQKTFQSSQQKPGGFHKPAGAYKPGGFKPGGFQRPAGQTNRPAFQGGQRPQQSGSQGGQSGQRSFSQDRKNFVVYINENIKAPNIMIIEEDGSNTTGVIPRRRALEIAEEKGLDLVQINYNQEQMLSTVKLVDYGKYMYQKQKDEKEKKKNQKPNVIKEIKLNYMIGENDLQLKIKKAREMFADGYHVKFSIKLKGREKIYTDKAIERLKSIKDSLVDVSRSQYETPKQEAQGYSILLFAK